MLDQATPLPQQTLSGTKEQREYFIRIAVCQTTEHH